MEERGMIDFLKERLSDNYVSTNVENMNIPVVTNELCVVLKKRVVVCHVNDEAKAMFTLWRFATDELPCLFISSKRNTLTLLKDTFEEVFGMSINDIDMRKSASLAGFGSFLDDFSKKKIYINDSTKNLDDKSIKDMIVTYDIKVVVADSFDVLRISPKWYRRIGLLVPRGAEAWYRSYRSDGTGTKVPIYTLSKGAVRTVPQGTPR